jgi:hypothetical protein
MTWRAIGEIAMAIEGETAIVVGTKIEIVTEIETSPGDLETTSATGAKKDGERNVNAAGVSIPRESFSRPTMETTTMG